MFYTLPPSFYLYLASCLSNMACFITGTAISWSSPEIERMNTTQLLGRYVTEQETSWIGSLLSIGAVFGAPLFSLAADRWGRKVTVVSIGVPYLIAYLIFAFAQKIELFYFGRLLCGLGCSSALTLVPMYIAELADKTNRAALGTIMTCFTCSGMLFSYSLGPYISIMAFNLLLAAISAGFIIVFFIVAPETPHFLVSKERNAEARECLQKLRGKNDDIEAEMEEVTTNIYKSEKGSFRDLFESKGVIRAFIIGVVLSSLEQLSGINAVLYYTTQIFKDVGSSLEPEHSSIVIGATQFISSFIAPMFAERTGKKILLIISGVGMALTHIPLGLYFFLKSEGVDVSSISWLPIVAMVFLIFMNNCGIGSVIPSIVGEIFPPSIKFMTASLIGSFCGIAGFLNTKYFVDIVLAIGRGPAFWIYSCICLLMAIFTKFFVFETRGMTLQEIQEELKNPKGDNNTIKDI